MEYRKYLSKGDIFEGFPDGIRWHAAEMAKGTDSSSTLTPNETRYARYVIKKTGECLNLALSLFARFRIIGDTKKTSRRPSPTMPVEYKVLIYRLKYDMTKSLPKIAR